MSNEGKRSRCNGNNLGAELRRERVQVVVRCRPLLQREIAEGRINCVSVDKQHSTVQVRNIRFPDLPPKLFTFDRTYDNICTQRELYDDAAHPIVHSVMCGYNGTVLAYGQTASGKTFTMEGLENPPEKRGIIPLAFEDIFAHIEQSKSSDHFLVRASYLEIYNEEIRDLLVQSPNHYRLELKESGDAGVYVKNLTSVTVQSVSDITRLLVMGKKNRSVGATLMNQDSSRSHSIFSVTVETSAGPSAENDGASHNKIRVGKLNLVDLAGSERLNKTGATGDRFRELTNINWSLSALGNVISALVDGKTTHIPYRDSKLTRLLQDSLGGNTRTVMLANIGPSDYNFDESISTLRYANRAKNIKNKPRINEDPKDAILREFQEEIARLKAQLQMSIPDPESHVDGNGKREKEIQQYKDQIRQNMEQEVSLHKTLSEQAMACIKADLERKAQLEMEALKVEKERTEEEKQKIAEELLQQHMELQSHYQALIKEKEDREVLAQKLKALEEKLLHGSNMANEKLSEKAKELAMREQQIRDKEFLDEERKHKIAELEEAQLMVEEKCSTMEEDVEVKTRKLRKLMARYQQSKAEITTLRTELQDTIHEFQRESADMFLSLRSLDQQLQLKSFIIESLNDAEQKFIPPEEVSKIMRRAIWDEENETWVLQSMFQKLPSSAGDNRLYLTDGINKQPLQRPVSAMGRSRPMCQQAEDAIARGDCDPRYLVDNILRLELDMPERTTYDYDNPSDRARAEADVELALMEFEEDTPYYSYESTLPTPARPKSARTKHPSRPKTATR